MRRSLVELLRGPKCRHPLRLHELQTEELTREGEANVLEGILSCRPCRTAYPIVHGVPLMLDSTFPQEFLERYADQIARDEVLAGLSLRGSALPDWSFSTEWEAHFRSGLFRTWGWTVDERVRQFFQETDT